MHPKKVSVIINPSSGNGKTRKNLKKIVKEIKSYQKDAKILLTHHNLHAIALTKEELLNGVDRIVAVGGDGTLNEVVNGFFDQNGMPYNKEASLALIPSGSGSDFARNIPIENNIHSMTGFALNAPAVPTDLGFIKAKDDNGRDIQRYFVNVASAGLSGLVAGFMKQTTRKMGAKAAYFFATVKALNAFKAPKLKITTMTEEKIVENCSIASFANGKYYGSGMKIAPDALLDDGLFDCITIKDLTPLFFLLNGYKVYQGSHLGMEQVGFFRDFEIMVESLGKDPIYVETDGELFAQLPAKFYLQKHKILVAR